MTATKSTANEKTSDTSQPHCVVHTCHLAKAAKRSTWIAQQHTSGVQQRLHHASANFRIDQQLPVQEVPAPFGGSPLLSSRLHHIQNCGAKPAMAGSSATEQHSTCSGCNANASSYRNRSPVRALSCTGRGPVSLLAVKYLRDIPQNSSIGYNRHYMSHEEFVLNVLIA